MVQPKSEVSCFEQGPSDVVGEVPEHECGAAQEFETTIDHLGRSVASDRLVEIGLHIGRAPVPGPYEGMSSGSTAAAPRATESIAVVMSVLPWARSRWQ